MELRQFAERVVLAGSLEEKLAGPVDPLTDSAPGPAVRPEIPGRPDRLLFAPRRTAPAMPRPAAFANPQKRAVAHHIMANHELQALEVMGFVLLAFPEAPADFRRGLVRVMQDEQRHARLHADRAAELGIPFGSLPVNAYIWNKAQSYRCLLDYLAGLPLTFESCNLDHTLEFEEYFLQAGDERSAAVMRTIHRDEIGHVAFGLEWLRRLKAPDQSDWDAYCSHLHWPLRPAKARGERFHHAPRRAAGMDDEFLHRLERAATDDDPLVDHPAPS